MVPNQSKNLTYTILPTLACNCRCSYCYETDRSVKPDYDKIWQSLSSEIDKDLASGKIAGGYGLYLIGGETLLEVKNLDWLLTKTLDKNPNITSLHVQSNGTLIEDDCKIQAFLRKWSDKLPTWITISLDGIRDCHNAHRFLADGTPSWDKAFGGLMWCRANLPSVKGYRIHSIINHDTIPLISAGMKQSVDLGIELATFFPNTFETWTAEDVQPLYQQFKEGIDYASRAQDLRTAFGYFDTLPYSYYYGCPTIHGRYTTIAPDGQLYGCVRLASEGTKQARAFNATDFWALKERQCKDCDLKDYCFICPAGMWVNATHGLHACWYGFMKALIKARAYYAIKGLSKCR